MSPRQPLVIPLAACCLALAPCLAQTADYDVPADKAVLLVRLPASATLRIGSSATSQTGGERLFVSPVLAPGKTYTYELTAVWREKDQPRKTIRRAEVRPGAITTVDFNVPQTSAVAASSPGVRNFQFTYAATVTGLKPGQLARIWLPVPSSNGDQDVEILTKDLPVEERIQTEPRYGNRILYLEAKASAKGEVPARMVYRVKRREVKGDASRDLKEDAKQLARLLQPDVRVPIAGKPLELIKGKTVPTDEMAAARIFYDVVNGHMRYSKEGVGWGNGDSVWACEKGYGNCSDFHSLFISLARAHHIPAKFEIGFPLPPKRGAGDIPGYHCWAKFHPAGKGWVPVDISEANKNPSLRDYYFGNLTEDRVGFSTGRDFDLVPRQAGPPLNFLIYPYVEVDGKEYPQAKITRRFGYRDAG